MIPWQSFHHEFHLEDILILILFLIWFSHNKVACYFGYLQRNNYWVGGIKRVHNFYGMQNLTGNGGQKLWHFTYHNIIHAAFCWAKKVMVKAFYLNYLVVGRINTFSILDSSKATAALTMQEHLDTALDHIKKHSLVCCDHLQLNNGHLVDKYLHVSSNLFKFWLHFIHWHKIQPLHWHISCWCPLSMILQVSQGPCTCRPMPCKIPWNSHCFFPMLNLWESLPFSSWYNPPQVEY